MKFYNSNYFEEDGLSVVTVEHMGEYFYGTSTLLEEDKDKASKFTGCRFAEMKAKIKALKYERNIEKEKCEEIRKFVKACSQYKGWDKDSSTAKAIYKQLNKRIKKVNLLTDKINQLYSELYADFRRQDMVVAALKRKKMI